MATVMESKYNSMLPEGTILAGRYRIDKYLSSGGCGNTYLVTDMKFASSRTRVVIKEFFLAERTYRSTGSSRVVVTNPDNQALVTKLREKFKRESKLIFSLKHPNIVSVSDYFDANDTSYYVMQYVEGGSLAKKLEDEGPLAEEDALRYIRQVLSALYVMHAEGLYHLDLKPANIMLDAYDNAKLIDFGASKIADDDSGKFSTTTPLYTRGFAPTEQIEGVLSRLGAWTDIYAVGATLYNLLSGMAPPMPSEILERGEGAFALSDDVSPCTQKAIAAFMQQSRSKRPQSVEEAEVLLFGKVQKHVAPKKLAGPANEKASETQLPDETQPVGPDSEATKTFETMLPVAGNPVSAPAATPAPADKKNLWIGIVAAIIAAVAVIVVFFAISGDENTQEPASEVTTDTIQNEEPVVMKESEVHGYTIIRKDGENIKLCVNVNDRIIEKNYEWDAYGEVIDEHDYDGDGTNDCLLWTGDGGSTPAMYSIAYVNMEKMKLEEAEFDVIDDRTDHQPTPINQNGKWYFVVKDGINTKKYVFDNGKLQKVEDKDMKTSKAQITYKFVDVFGMEELNVGEKTILKQFDIDGDGNTETFVFSSNQSHASDWGKAMFLTIRWSDNRQSQVGGGHKIAVLSSKSNGLYDILFDDKHLYKWNGREYVDMN